MNVYFIRHAELDYEHDTAAFLTEKWELPAQPVDWARELLWGSGSGDGKDRLSSWAHFNVDVTSVSKFYFGGGGVGIPACKACLFEQSGSSAGKIGLKNKRHSPIANVFLCGGADLNGHDLRHKHLKLACLPIPPPPQNVIFNIMK